MIFQTKAGQTSKYITDNRRRQVKKKYLVQGKNDILETNSWDV